MATIKGQNLRLFLNGVCVAASKNTTVHLAAQTESVSTKDDTDNWDRINITSISWDAGVDALVASTAQVEKNMKISGDTEQTIEIDGETYHIIAGTFMPCPANDFSVCAAMSGYLLPDDAYLSLLGVNDDQSEGELLARGKGYDIYAALFAPHGWDYIVFALTTGQQDDRNPVDVNATFVDSNAKTLPNIEALATSKTPLTVVFSQANGLGNRVSTGKTYSGVGYISDIQVNAQNQVNSSYSVKITGTGELERIR